MKLFAAGVGGGSGSGWHNVMSDIIRGKLIQMGQEFTGRVTLVGADVAYVDIGLGRFKEGFINPKGLRNGQKIKVKIFRLEKGPSGELNIYLDKVRSLEDTQRSAKMPEPETGSFCSELRLYGERYYDVKVGKKIFVLPERLLIISNAGKKTIPIVKTGIEDYSSHEICCDADFIPIAQALLEVITNGREFGVEDAYIERISEFGTGRKVPQNKIPFLITAADPIKVGDAIYHPCGIFLASEDQCIGTREKALFRSRDFCFRLSMEEFNSSWTAWDLIQEMAKRQLLINRV